MAERVKIYEVTDAAECHDSKGNAIPFLSFDGKRDGAKLAHVHDCSTESMAELCDHDAENKNRHAFCGVHRALIPLLEREIGKTNTKIAMRTIAQHGGLQEISE